MIRPCVMAVLAGAIAVCALAADDAPPPEAFRVREQPLSPGETTRSRSRPTLTRSSSTSWIATVTDERDPMPRASSGARTTIAKEPGTASITRENCLGRKTKREESFCK